MTKEKNTIRTELLFDSDGESKLKLSVEWDKNKKKACVIMLRFGKGDGIYFDKMEWYNINRVDKHPKI